MKNWEDYDKEKMFRGEDKDYFSCEDNWEVNYLKNKIIEEHPYMDEKIILFAIHFTWANSPSSKRRIDFIENVSDLLAIPMITAE
jgi:hypothetical protein